MLPGLCLLLPLAGAVTAPAFFEYPKPGYGLVAALALGYPIIDSLIIGVASVEVLWRSGILPFVGSKICLTALSLILSPSTISIIGQTPVYQTFTVNKYAFCRTL
jgi:hypothetical protein